MARATERPFGVSFAAGWAAVAGALSLLQAMGLGLVGAASSTATGALVGLVLAVVQLLLGLGLNGTALVLLALAGDAFRTEGPDVDESGSVNSVR